MKPPHVQAANVEEITKVISQLFSRCFAFLSVCGSAGKKTARESGKIEFNNLEDSWAVISFNFVLTRDSSTPDSFCLSGTLLNVENWH